MCPAILLLLLGITPNTTHLIKIITTTTINATYSLIISISITHRIPATFTINSLFYFLLLIISTIIDPAPNPLHLRINRPHPQHKLTLQPRQPSPQLVGLHLRSIRPRLAQLLSQTQHQLPPAQHRRRARVALSRLVPLVQSLAHLHGRRDHRVGQCGDPRQRHAVELR
jgi:hypothetical protein